jgi:quercetin dioxygenase-like cupin family protein
MNPSDSPTTTEKGSRIHRCRLASGSSDPHTWAGVPIQDYKAAAEHHCGVLREVLIGGRGEQTSFQVRYFEVSPGGYTSREYHQHEHAVVVLRGSGEVCLGDAWHPVGYGDVVYVGPHEVHQLRNRSSEPFGFLCIVDAERDQPIRVSGKGD